MDRYFSWSVASEVRNSILVTVYLHQIEQNDYKFIFKRFFIHFYDWEEAQLKYASDKLAIPQRLINKKAYLNDHAQEKDFMPNFQ